MTNVTIDEFAFWGNRSLTPAEILDLYNSEAGISPPSQPQLEVNLIEPLDNTITGFENIKFNSTYTSLNGNLTNASFYVWYSNSSLFKRTLTIVNTEY